MSPTVYMKVFADTADLSVMESLRDRVTGFTSNPTLCKTAGVTDYAQWGQQVASTFPNHSVSIEVVADDLANVERQARLISSWGDKCFAKVPISLTNGTPTNLLVGRLVEDGARVNVTAIFTPSQLTEVYYVYKDAQPSVPMYVSVFAGRIADTGQSASRVVSHAAEFAPKGVKVVWASTREVWNVVQARKAGAHIVTLSPSLIDKLDSCYEKDLTEFSLDTVKQFHTDALAAGLSL